MTLFLPMQILGFLTRWLIEDFVNIKITVTDCRVIPNRNDPDHAQNTGAQVNLLLPSPQIAVDRRLSIMSIAKSRKISYCC